MRLDHAALVEQRQAAGRFKHTLDHEHHVRAAGRRIRQKQSATLC